MDLTNYFLELVTDKRKGFFAALISFLLYLLSLLYGLAVRFLAFFYAINPYRASCVVIGVGNITLGGTGKTPLVEWLARYVRSHRKKTAILTRGYGGGDEPAMLAAKLPDVPVLVDKDRVKTIRRAVKDHGVDAVILDDAFQQWRIVKDLNILTIGVDQGFGNRHLLPRGVLREPFSALKRADVFVLHQAGQAQDTASLRSFLSRINPRAEIVETALVVTDIFRLNDAGHRLEPGILKGKRAGVFSGIGNPAAFEQTVRGLGTAVEAVYRFRDHHIYTPADISVMCQEARSLDLLITTEKDAVRFPATLAADLPCAVYVVAAEMRITNNEQGFRHRLSGLFAA